MTNTEIIQEIKAEIERLREENNNIRCDSNKAYCQGYGDAFVDLLPLLDTIESEKPMNQEEIDLKKELHDFIMEFGPAATFDKCASRFYDIGCRRTAEKYDEIEYNRQRTDECVPKDLEEAAVNIADELLAKPKDYALSARVDYWNGVHDGVVAGAKWQKEQDDKELSEKIAAAYHLGLADKEKQMMEEAVEGEVCYGSEGAYIETDYLGEYNTDVYGNPGDKVRIIIVKED